MLKEATLVTSSGIPIWVRTTGPSVVNGILAGAMLGALSMFSSEITGQVLKSIEMSDGFSLRVRPFADGSVNLAIIGDEDILSDPELLTIIDQLDDDIELMFNNQADVDLNDQNTNSIYLEKSIKLLDEWFDSRHFAQKEIMKERDEKVVEISSQIAVMTSRFLQENIGVLILDSALEAIFTSSTSNITPNIINSLQAHLKAWVKVSSHNEDQLLPELIYFDRFCVGIKAQKRFYIVCILEWTGSLGNNSTTSKVRSWLSTLSRRFGT